MTPEPVEFLLARIAEDEALACAATPGPWGYDGDDHTDIVFCAEPHPASLTGPWPQPSTFVAETSYDDQSMTTYNSEADGLHIARHDPARVLAECKAKRLILAECETSEADLVQWPIWRAMALPYADHPDFDPAWKHDQGWGKV